MNPTTVLSAYKNPVPTFPQKFVPLAISPLACGWLTPSAWLISPAHRTYKDTGSSGTHTASANAHGAQGAAYQLNCTHYLSCPISSGGMRKESESDSHQEVLTLTDTRRFPDFTKLFESPEQIRIAGRTAPAGIPLSDGKQSRRSACGLAATKSLQR